MGITGGAAGANKALATAVSNRASATAGAEFHIPSVRSIDGSDPWKFTWAIDAA